MTLQEGLTRIGKYCFRKSRIEMVSLPSTLEEVARDAFAECAYL